MPDQSSWFRVPIPNSGWQQLDSGKRAWEGADVSQATSSDVQHLRNLVYHRFMVSARHQLAPLEIAGQRSVSFQTWAAQRRGQELDPELVRHWAVADLMSRQEARGADSEAILEIMRTNAARHVGYSVTLQHLAPRLIGVERELPAYDRRAGGTSPLALDLKPLESDAHTSPVPSPPSALPPVPTASERDAALAIDQTCERLAAMPSNWLDEHEADDLVRSDVENLAAIGNPTQRYFAAVAVGDSARRHSAYQTALEQQAFIVAAEVAAALREEDRRAASRQQLELAKSEYLLLQIEQRGEDLATASVASAADAARSDAQAVRQITSANERSLALLTMGWRAYGYDSYRAALREIAPDVEKLASALQVRVEDGAYSLPRDPLEDALLDAAVRGLAPLPADPGQLPVPMPQSVSSDTVEARRERDVQTVADFVQAHHARTAEGVKRGLAQASIEVRQLLGDEQRMRDLDVHVNAKLAHLLPARVARIRAVIATELGHTTAQALRDEANRQEATLADSTAKANRLRPAEELARDAQMAADFMQEHHARTPYGVARGLERAPVPVRALLANEQRMAEIDGALNENLAHLNPAYVAETKAIVAVALRYSSTQALRAAADRQWAAEVQRDPTRQVPFESSKLLLVRIQDDLSGVHHDSNGLTWQAATPTDCNTLHFGVNTVPGGDGSIAIIATPREMPVPAGWGQADAWWRLRSQHDASGQMQRSLGLGHAVIVAPLGTRVPEGARVVFYNGDTAARDHAIQQLFTDHESRLHEASADEWTDSSPEEHARWRRDTSSRLWPGHEEHIHLDRYQGSTDHALEGASLGQVLQAMRENGPMYSDPTGAEAPYVDMMERRVEEVRQDVDRLLWNETAAAEAPLIAAHYRGLLRQLQNQLQKARELDPNQQSDPFSFAAPRIRGSAPAGAQTDTDDAPSETPAGTTAVAAAAAQASMPAVQAAAPTTPAVVTEVLPSSQESAAAQATPGQAQRVDSILVPATVNQRDGQRGSTTQPQPADALAAQAGAEATPLAEPQPLPSRGNNAPVSATAPQAAGDKHSFVEQIKQRHAALRDAGKAFADLDTAELAAVASADAAALRQIRTRDNLVAAINELMAAAEQSPYQEALRDADYQLTKAVESIRFEAHMQSLARRPARRGGLEGELLEQGTAPYQFQGNEKTTCYARYRNDQGEERTVWGRHLPAALIAAGAQVGDRVWFTRKPTPVELRQANNGELPCDLAEFAFEVMAKAAQLSATPVPAAPAVQAQVTAEAMAAMTTESLESGTTRPVEEAAHVDSQTAATTAQAPASQPRISSANVQPPVTDADGSMQPRAAQPAQPSNGPASVKAQTPPAAVETATDAAPAASQAAPTTQDLIHQELLRRLAGLRRRESERARIESGLAAEVSAEGADTTNQAASTRQQAARDHTSTAHSSDEMPTIAAQACAPAPADTTPQQGPRLRPALDMTVDGFTGDPADARPSPSEHISQLLESMTFETQRNGSVLYMLRGDPAFIDHGEQILMHKTAAPGNDDAVLAAMLMAKEKWGGKLEITGSHEFKQRAIAIMVKHNIDVELKNPEQDAIRRRLMQEGPAVDQTSPGSGQVPVISRPAVPREVLADPVSPVLHQVPAAASSAASVSTSTGDGRRPATAETLAPGSAQAAISGTTQDQPASEDANSAAPATSAVAAKIEGATDTSHAARTEVAANAALRDRSNASAKDARGRQALADELVPVDACNWWSVQRAGVGQWFVGAEREAELKRLGPQPAHGEVFWFDKVGRRRDPPEDAQAYKAWLRAQSPKEQADPAQVVLRGLRKNGDKTEVTVLLFKGGGDYLQGYLVIDGKRQPVIAHITQRAADPDTGEVRPNYLRLHINDGNPNHPQWREIGYGNAINHRGDGKPVYFDEMLLNVGREVLKARVTGSVEPTLHRNLGFIESRKQRIAKEATLHPLESAAPKARPAADEEAAAGAPRKGSRRSARARAAA